MRRPRKIKVGYRTYSVQWVSSMTMRSLGFDKTKAAAINREGGEILVCIDRKGKPLPEEYLRECLMHEVMHAVAYVSTAYNTWYLLTKSGKEALDYDDVDEWLVGEWSPVLIKVLQDNPSLVAYLVGS